MDITSPSNPRIKRLVALRHRRERDREGVFVVEGLREVERAAAAGMSALEVYYDPARYPGPPLASPIEFAVASEALDRASYRSSSQGLIAVFARFDVTLGHLVPVPNPLYLVAESIEKPGNLGAVLRIADAAGASGVIVTDTGADPFNPNVIRSSTGTLFSVPLAMASLEETVAWCHSREMTIFAADPTGGDSLWDADLTRPCSLLVGSEHAGLSDAARSSADHLVTIPMRGTADSLNVSVSVAILVYEALRQRRSSHDP
jgi:TrmH family RNA methyltransferase